MTSEPDPGLLCKRPRRTYKIVTHKEKSKQNEFCAFLLKNTMKDFKDMSATEIKDRGNTYFAKKQYDSAIDCYSKAIVSI